MGIIPAVDSPQLSDDTLSSNFTNPLPEDHGTKAAPSEIPLYVDLYFHSEYIMNTTASTSVDTNTSIPGSTITFLLQKELINDYFVENPVAGFAMVAVVFLSGNGQLDVTVSDATGPTVGTATYGPFNLGSLPQMQTINIPFDSGMNYTFATNHFIEIEFAFTNTGRLHYDSVSAPSLLQLYGTTVPDISLITTDFFSIPQNTFYPYNIDFPNERKEVNVEGVVTEVFGKDGEIQYIEQVQVQIAGPGYDQTYAAFYNKITYEYKYNWNYFNGQSSGEYTITIHVFDEQNNEFTITGTFNMSYYGVLLTSPSQDPQEGAYKADARRNVVQYTKTVYTINVRNIGNADTVVNLTSVGTSSWDWWLEGENLINDNRSKNDTVMIISPGEKREIWLVVDSTDRPISALGIIIVTATCIEEPMETSSLVTLTTVVIYPLLEGWNLISVPFIQSNTNITPVLSSIGGSYDAAQWFNVSDISDPWKHHHTSKASRLNDLTNIDHTMGFWIHIIEPGGAYFDYAGTPPSSNQTISLHNGWNQVGYPALRSYNRSLGLNNLTFGTHVEAIQWYDAATQTWHFMDQDDYFVPGRGYWVHSKVETSWEVPL
jgi:hypothetical protein